jgi:hypothetical protein
MGVELSFSEPNRPFPFTAVVAVPDFKDPPKRMRVAIAYLTYGGLIPLLDNFRGHLDLSSARTEWIVGIHNGITEPRALQAVLAMRNARIRLFSPTRDISRKALMVAPRMHAKLIAATDQTRGQWVSLLVGSANLTSATASNRAVNFEAGATLWGADVGRAGDAFERWWRAVSAFCIRGDEPTIKKYAALRERFLVRAVKPIDVLDLDPPHPDDVRQSRFFWLDAGDMSGGNDERYRYQTEINDYMALFFHAERPKTTFEVVMPSGDRLSGSVTERRKYHFVPLWRLSLPSPRRFGLEYRNHLLRFERLGEARFRLEVFDLSGSEMRECRRKSNRQGYLGRTGTKQSPDGREWGIFGEVANSIAE